MAIQGTQVPMYTNTHRFCIFLIFQFFLMKNKVKKKTEKKKNKQKHVKQNKVMHKTRLIQN